ncbi:MAG: ester cyclase [Halobacteriota archaeon]
MATTTAEESKAVVAELFERIDAHDASVFDDLFAPDFTSGIYRSGTGEGVEGIDGVTALWEEYWTAFPDLRGETTEVIVEGDDVAVFREEVGTHEGDFRGIAPTGNEITFEYAGHLVVEDGEIVHAHFLGNILNLVTQLGVDSPIPR